MRLAILAIITLTGSYAFAAGGGGIPTKTIIVQVLNLSIAIGILVYFLRQPIKDFFRAKKEDFESEVVKAQKEKADAETVRNEIRAKVQKLKTETAADLQVAQKEADALKTKMIQDAQETAKKIEADALNKAHYEMQNAIQELRDELLNRSLDMARENLQTEIPSSDLSRLKLESIEKIQVVQ